MRARREGQDRSRDEAEPGRLMVAQSGKTESDSQFNSPVIPGYNWKADLMGTTHLYTPLFTITDD